MFSENTDIILIDDVFKLFKEVISMTLTLEKSLKNREHIIKCVKEEIIGPEKIRENYVLFVPEDKIEFESKEELYKPYYWERNGRKEEILQRQTPLQRYVSGILFPLTFKRDSSITLETPIEKEVIQKKQDKIDDLFEYQDDLELTEEDGDIELFPQNNEFRPSTMGLTFCIEDNIRSLEILLQGGIYHPHIIKVKGSSNSYTWWLRESIYAFWNLDLNILEEAGELKEFVDIRNFGDEVIPHLKFQFHAKLRKFDNKYIITISITNRSEKDKNIKKKEQYILFQSEMKIKTPIGQYFSFYPKQFEMKEYLTEEEASLELLYRNEGIYAFGHGCAAEWEQNSNRINEISTTFMPEYETLSMIPNIFIKKGDVEEELKIRMSDLAGITSREHPKKILEPLISEYEKWIEEKINTIEDSIPDNLINAAKKNMELCYKSLNRMKKGLQHLDDELILDAFRLANLAMLLQQKNGKNKREGIIEDNRIKYYTSYEENVIYKIQDIMNADNSWRAFQIAFLLLSIDSFVNESGFDREIVDLIWFPTGGGKTEAYLAVAAFQMILRRLKDPADAGTDIIMRYTLRLLTADQFQRASRLMCSLEYLRRKIPEKLGEEPFSIGIWVGSKTTPNNNKSALKMLRELLKNKRGAKQFIVNSCPWCGAKIGYYKNKDKNTQTYIGYKNEDDRLVVHCPDKKCPFFDELPVYIVDETIYKKRPTFLIGTIDKFVQLVWQPKARSLFGINNNGERFVSPPSLIIQDELHLISGPLGSLTGLFEVLIEELCLKEINGNIIRPKIIAATATIKHFKEQVLALFGREETYIFPSPGLDNNDSFFARPAVDKDTGEYMPGRKYVGVYTQTVRIMMAQVMTFSAIIQSLNEIKPDERDPYWTLMAFYNTLRELGSGLTLCLTDIPQYSRTIASRQGNPRKMRYLKRFLELTSRKQSHEISQTLDDLKTIYDPKNKKNKVIDICLASNIIEVGVDVDRLSLMAIVGQPKMTAQYIQVSGRVGRQWWERPGLIFTIYSNTKSRDKSHFEHFQEYHRYLYADVESSSITPFSEACLERGLNAVIVGYLRQALNETVAHIPDWNEISRFLERKIFPFYNRFLRRVLLVDSEQVDVFKEKFRGTLKSIEIGNYTAWNVSPKANGYMYPSGSSLPSILKRKSVSMINSMRNVDSECRGRIVSIYNSEDPGKISWEELFS